MRFAILRTIALVTLCGGCSSSGKVTPPALDSSPGGTGAIGTGATGTGATGNGGTSTAGGTGAVGAGVSGYGGSTPGGLGWPVDCILGTNCRVGLPDIDKDSKSFDCRTPGYSGHEGSDFSISQAMMDQGTSVLAAADGVVQWVFDGKFDQCPNAAEPDCAVPSVPMGAGVSSGYMVCTDGSDAYCTGTKYTRACYYCFNGGNVVVLRHPENAQVFATRYDHLKKGSILVKPGDKVLKGQKIALVGSAGDSTGPHLHFEVWVGGFYQLAEPWAGPCGPNRGPSLWDNQPTVVR